MLLVDRRVGMLGEEDDRHVSVAEAAEVLGRLGRVPVLDPDHVMALEFLGVQADERRAAVPDLVELRVVGHEPEEEQAVDERRLDGV